MGVSRGIAGLHYQYQHSSGDVDLFRDLHSVCIQSEDYFGLPISGIKIWWGRTITGCDRVFVYLNHADRRHGPGALSGTQCANRFE